MGKGNPAEKINFNSLLIVEVCKKKTIDPLMKLSKIFSFAMILKNLKFLQKSIGWKYVGGVGGGGRLTRGVFKVKQVCTNEIVGPIMKFCEKWSFLMRMKNLKNS